MAEEIDFEKDLTEKQKRFCKEYIFDWNATRAAKAAGYSESTAYSIGWENLKKPEIQLYIKHLKANLAEVAGVSPLMVIQEHMKIAFSSIAHLHNTWIERKEFEKLTDEQKSCIQEIDTKIVKRSMSELNSSTGEFEEIPINIEYVKVKLFDKQKSLDAINKMLGYDAPTKTELTGKDGSALLSGDIKIVFK